MRPELFGLPRGTIVRSYGLMAALALAAACLCACGDSNLASGQTADDPDDAASPTSGTNYELVAVEIVRGDNLLTVALELDPAPLLPDAGAIPDGTEISGVLDVDADQNAGTGDDPLAETDCPQPPADGLVQWEYRVDLRERNSMAEGSGYPLINFQTPGIPVGEVTPVVSGSKLVLFIDRSDVDGNDLVNVAPLVGNGTEFTDCLPDTDNTSVPTNNPPES